MQNMRQFSRTTQSDTKALSVCIFKFNKLERMDLNARLLDVSPAGLGIEADSPLEPGIVWIKEGIEDRKGGVLIWSKKLSEHTYRGGIQFLSVSQDVFENAQEAERLAAYPEPLRKALTHPGAVASILLEPVR